MLLVNMSMCDMWLYKTWKTKSVRTRKIRWVVAVLS